MTLLTSIRNGETGTAQWQQYFKSLERKDSEDAKSDSEVSLE